jgi:hypothetical protein
MELGGTSVALPEHPALPFHQVSQSISIDGRQGGGLLGSKWRGV